ncbi:hypothetical protein [Neptunomonas phycophila]|nr:hypothetical protein [Neptunomonas phycophila]
MVNSEYISDPIYWFALMAFLGFGSGVIFSFVKSSFRTASF